MSLGANYDWGSGNTYASQITFPRNTATPYISIRSKEGGANTAGWGAWNKISAGYADNAGIAANLVAASSVVSDAEVDNAITINSSAKITSSINGASYFRGGDDAELWDVNVANTMGVYGVQNSAIGSIRFGSGGGIISGSSGRVGINNTSQSYAFDVTGDIRSTSQVYTHGGFYPGNGALQLTRKFGDDGTFLTASNLKMAGSFDAGNQVVQGLGQFRIHSGGTNIDLATSGGNSKFRFNITNGRLWVGGAYADASPSYVVEAKGNIVNSNPSQGWLGLTGDLSGYANDVYPTLKTSATCIYFDAASTYTGYICNSGGFTDVSDARLKENVVPVGSALDKVLQIRGVTFDWIDRPGTGRQMGLIAQELETVAPELVREEAGVKGIFYGGISALTIEAIKEQQGIIELQDNRLVNLETGIKLDANGDPLKNVVMNNTGELSLESDPNLIIFNPTDVSDLTDRLSEIEAQVAVKANQSDLDTLRNRFDELEAFVQSASMSAALMQDIVNTQATFDQISALNASGSATIAREITDTDIIIAKNLIEEGNLTVLGETNLSNLAVTGTISSGLLTIDGLSCIPGSGDPYGALGGGAAPAEECGTTISTLAGPIRIQHNGLADVTFVNDFIRMDIGGNLIVYAGDLEIDEGSIKGNDGIRGIDVSVAEGSNQIFVTFPNVNDTFDYAVGITPNWYTEFKVTEKTVEGFRVEFYSIAPLGATFDWIIIE